LTDRYVVALFGVGDPSKPLRLAFALLRFGKLVGRGGPAWETTERGGESVTHFKLRSLKLYLRPKLASGKTGLRFVTRSSDAPAVSITKVDTSPTILDTQTSPTIDVVKAYVIQSFGSAVYSLGDWYCRYIDGTRTVSKHGYRGRNRDNSEWLGAAWDIGARRGGMTTLQRVAHQVVALAEPSDAPLHGRISAVIVDDTIWTPGDGWHHYSGNPHTTHVHVDTFEGYACSP
jgi:hypothetical protein